MYRNEFENYIAKHGYTGIRALVAFSGKVSLDGSKDEVLPNILKASKCQVLTSKSEVAQ